MLFIESTDFTDGWAIYSDNIAMARWFQTTQLTDSTPSDTTIPVIDATFESSGDPRDYWTETCTSQKEVISMTWTGILDPVINHTKAEPGKFGVATTLIPCNEARITVNGKQLSNRSFPSEDPSGLPEFAKCTAFLAFCETWTEVKGAAL